MNRITIEEIEAQIGVDPNYVVSDLISRMEERRKEWGYLSTVGLKSILIDMIMNKDEYHLED